MSQNKQIVKRYVSGAFLLALAAIEAVVLYAVCEYRGFTTVWEFSLTALVSSAVLTLAALPMHRVLPVALWQVPVWVVALLLIGWHNPDPARFHYWTTMEHLRVGMTVSQVRQAAEGYPLFREQPHSKFWPPKPSVPPLPIPTAHFTGSVVCRPIVFNPRSDSGDDGTIITFSQGHVVNVHRYEDDT